MVPRLDGSCTDRSISGSLTTEVVEQAGCLKEASRTGGHGRGGGGGVGGRTAQVGQLVDGLVDHLLPSRWGRPRLRAQTPPSQLRIANTDRLRTATPHRMVVNQFAPHSMSAAIRERRIEALCQCVHEGRRSTGTNAFSDRPGRQICVIPVKFEI